MRPPRERRRILAAELSDLEALARASTGPHGKIKAVLQGTSGCPDFFLTSCSSRLIAYRRSLAIQPEVQVILDLAARQHYAYGDGGLRALCLAASLVRAAIEEERGQSLSNVCAAFSAASSWVVQWLRDECSGARAAGVAMPLRWSEPSGPLAFIRSVLCAKPLIARGCQKAHSGGIGGDRGNSGGEGTIALLANLTLQAFLASLSEEDRDGCSTKYLASHVRYLPVLGRPFSASVVLPGTIVVDLPDYGRQAIAAPLRKHRRRRMRRKQPLAASLPCSCAPSAVITVALFEVSLQPPADTTVNRPHMPVQGRQAMTRTASGRKPKSPCTIDEGGGGVVGASTSNLEAIQSAPPPNAKASELTVLRYILNELLEHRTGLVASQRLIHPWLVRRLAAAGVVVLQRLSSRHIAAVQRLTGAEVLSDGWGRFATAAARAVGSRSGDGGVGGAGSPVCTAFLGVLHHPRPLSAAFRGRRGGGGAGVERLVLRAPSETAVGALVAELRKGHRCGRGSGEGSTGRGIPRKGGDDGFEGFRRGVLARRAAVATFLLAGPDQQALEELHCAVKGAVIGLNHALTQPYVLRGAGRWEALAAAVVRQRAQQICAPRPSQNGRETRCASAPRGAGSRAVAERPPSDFLRGLHLFAGCLERSATPPLKAAPGAASAHSPVIVDGAVAALATIELSTDAAICATRLLGSI